MSRVGAWQGRGRFVRIWAQVVLSACVCFTEYRLKLFQFVMNTFFSADTFVVRDGGNHKLPDVPVALS